MRELSELLADSVDARTRSVAGLTPDADDISTIVRTVRRRRVVRHTLQTLAAVPLAGGLAVGAYFGYGALQPAPVDPAATPTVSTPAPTTGELETGALQTVPGMPSYYEAPGDLAAHVGEGWTALTYRPVAASNTAGVGPEPLDHALVLAAPDGTLFRTASIDAGLDLHLLDWDAQSTQARVWWAEDGTEGLTVGWLDVFTGELTADAEQFDQWAVFLGHADDGAELWLEDPPYVDGAPTGGLSVWALETDGSRREVASLSSDGWPRVEQSGTRFLAPAGTDALVVVDVATGESRELTAGPDGLTCVAVGWLDADAVLSLCHEPVSQEAQDAMDRVDFVAQDAGLYRIPVAGGEPERIHTFTEGEAVPEPWSGVQADAGAVAFVASSGFPGGCSVGVAAWDGSSVRSLLGRREHEANIFSVRRGAAGSVLVTASQSCESSGVQAEVSGVDVANATVQLLTPWVEAAPEDGADYWHQTVTSAVAAR